MAMIFPGMDPYLENPAFWPGIHNRLIVYIADQLQQRMPTRYIAAVEERVFVEASGREFVPDVWIKRTEAAPVGSAAALLEADVPVVIDTARGLEIHESYVAILDRDEGQSIVTVIEVVSPSNKTKGAGRRSYEKKQWKVLESKTHLVEIDLLRAGRHVVAVPAKLAKRHGSYSTLVCVNRSRERRNLFEVYFRELRDALPRVSIPLVEPDPDVVLDLRAAIAQTYSAGQYQRRVRYDEPCVPSLSPEDQAWADDLIRTAGAEPH